MVEFPAGTNLTPRELGELKLLIDGIKRQSPAQSAVFFLPNEVGNIQTLMGFPTIPIEDYPRLSPGSFVHERVKAYKRNKYKTPRTYPAPWNSYDLQGVDPVLNAFGIERDSIAGAIDFVFPIKNIPIVGLLVNPYDSPTAKEPVPFSDKDSIRFKEFLNPFLQKIRDTELDASDLTLSYLGGRIGFTGLETPCLEGFGAHSSTIQRYGSFGGDFIYADLKEGRALYVLADVSGKSYQATPFNSFLRASLFAFTRSKIKQLKDLKLEDLMRGLNEVANENPSFSDEFATAFAFYLDDNGNVIYSSAGHRAYIIGANDKQEELESLGYAIGMVKSESLFIDEPYRQTRLLPGEILAVWSDGFSENPDQDRNLFGDERILNCINGNRTKSLEEIGDILEEEVRQFSKGFYIDDRSLLLVRRKAA
jgi:hypothetical protein